MGFHYLNEYRWSGVTRDERFFCQRLYQLINAESPKEFVQFLRTDHGLEISADGEWEIAYEVCFYRDLWHHRGRKGPLYSPKRTFDLCLFGENAILIIEAKAAVDFDPGQTAVFAQDIEEVKKLSGVGNVRLLGLCSSRCSVSQEIVNYFTGPILRWSELAARYGDDEQLLRADGIYEPGNPFSGAGRHSDAKLSGAALRDAARGGAAWWVGRSGGLDGASFRADVQTGRWRRQQYEVSTTARAAPSANYFSLRDFARVIDERGAD